MKYPTIWIFGMGITVAMPAAIAAESYPSKAVRLVTGSVGSSSDFAMRLIAQGVSGRMSQQVVVENRPGSFAAADAVAKAGADGYTLLGATTALWTGPLLRKTSYDPVTDFAAVTLVSIEPNLVVISPSLQVNSIKELISLAKAMPAKLNYTTSSIGSLSHLAGELFKSMARVRIVDVVYTNDAQEIADLISGRVQLTFNSGAKVEANIKAGKLRALAVCSAQPSSLFPGLPTVAASLPGYESVVMVGILAPSKTPRSIIAQLNDEITRFLDVGDTKNKFLASGAEVVAGPPEQFGSAINSDIARWRKVIDEAGIKVE